MRIESNSAMISCSRAAQGEQCIAHINPDFIGFGCEILPICGEFYLCESYDRGRMSIIGVPSEKWEEELKAKYRAVTRIQYRGGQ